jgi:hypothetical protein
LDLQRTFFERGRQLIALENVPTNRKKGITNSKENNPMHSLSSIVYEKKYLLLSGKEIVNSI